MNRLLVLVLLLLMPGNGYAKQAQALLYPTRLVLENNERSATMGLKNSGDATGGYRVELVDMHMDESGTVEQVKDGQAEPFSARHFIRISPRSITLEPGQDQTVRILVRMPKDLPEGEYRTHIKVTLAENNLDVVENKKQEPATKEMAVVIKSRLSLIIPLIIRHGATSYHMGIADADVQYRDNGNGSKIPYADIILTRQGNRSAMGDLDIEYVDNKGKKHQLKHLAGVPVYRPTERRKVSLPLEVPPGVTIGQGKLHVIYQAQQKEGSILLAERTFTLAK